MDSCTFQPFIGHQMDRQLMMFEKNPCNNKEVPLYFLRKLWAEFVLSQPINYFDIHEFEGVGRGSTPEQENSKHEPLRGPHPPRQRHKPASQYLPILDNTREAQTSISTLTCSLLQHYTFIALSHRERSSSDGGGGVGTSVHSKEVREESSH